MQGENKSKTSLRKILNSFRPNLKDKPAFATYSPLRFVNIVQCGMSKLIQLKLISSWMSFFRLKKELSS